MYIVTNITKGTTSECDAIETIKAVDNKYIPAEQDIADGFKALTIVHVSPSEEYFTEEVFVYDGHYLTGTEDTGMFEDIPEPEPEEEENAQ